MLSLKDYSFDVLMMHFAEARSTETCATPEL